MANAWLRPHPPQGPADSGMIAQGGTVMGQDLSAPGQPDAARTIDELRASVTEGPQDISSALSGITMAAFTLTEATGAALALETEGAMICCARAGETAPPLGATLDLNSGISGECLRTATPQLCSDAFTDPRVDAEASRWLGVRSLAAVPLRNQSGVVGILEIFSDRPHVFSDSHTRLLQQLAEIAVASTSQQVHGGGPVSSSENGVEESKVDSGAAIFSVSLSRRLATVVSNREALRLAASAIAVLAVLVLLGWFASRTFHHTALDSISRNAASAGKASTHAAAEPIAADGSDRGGASFVRKPSPAVSVAAKEVVVPASDVAGRERTVPLQVVPSAGASKPTAESTADSAEEPAPPEISQLLANPQDRSSAIPAAIVTPSSALPEEKVEVSQGVTGGTILHRVTPIYPERARVQGIEGMVVLRGIIAENGSLQGLKVVRGDPILALAAKQAVSQWRYAPYQLNGKPVRLSTDITIEFKLPHQTP